MITFFTTRQAVQPLGSNLKRKKMFSIPPFLFSPTGNVVKGIRITSAELPCHDFVVVTPCSNHKALF